jgi:uncharacterized protein YggU (UPF0235/DUF167 family)
VVIVRLTPKSSRDAVEGIEMHGDRPVVKARVRAAPEKGKANMALEKLIAKWLGVPKTSVALVAGGTGRVKSLEVAGDAETLAARLEDRLGQGR